MEKKVLYYTPKWNEQYQKMVDKYGDPGFTKGKAYKLQKFTWWAGVSSLYLINDDGEEIAMNIDYVMEVDSEGNLVKGK